MKVLVVGGAGYVGAIVRPLLEAHHQCTHYNLTAIPDCPERCVVGDVADTEKITHAVHGQDVVLYMPMGTVQGTDGKPNANDLDAAFNINARDAYRCFGAALTAGVRRLVYASSLSVYERLHRIPPVDESRPATAWHAYGLSKRLGELVCAAAGQEYPEATIVALRLMLPRQPQHWPGHEYVPGRAHNHCALGPSDTARLFLAAVNCQKPGVHILQTTGDLEDKHFPNTRAGQVLGWRPEGR